MLEFRVEGAVPGDELRLKAHHPLRIHARAWGDPQSLLNAKGKLETDRYRQQLALQARKQS